MISDQPLPDDVVDDIQARARFFVPDLADDVEFATEYALGDLFSLRPILLLRSTSTLLRLLERIRYRTFDIDPYSNPGEGWNWCCLNASFVAPERGAAHARFASYVTRLRAQALSKCYVFGTGPSLEQAAARDWSDGYRIVCNTIVRDAELWQHLKPHFVVAADAIYHFGFTPFALQFRADLRTRLAESETYFVYPEAFHGLVLADLGPSLEPRCIPVPQGVSERIHDSLEGRFALPNLGNVLNLVLLPLACTMSRNVYLWGFDGRAPDDELFWANSSKHSYPELMHTLRAAHPAFFEYHVPSDKPATYVAKFHGDQLDELLSIAERAGWTFVMMHKSWTSTLQKRFGQGRVK